MVRNAERTAEVVRFDRESTRACPRCLNKLQGLHSDDAMRGISEGYQSVSGTRSALVPFWKNPCGKGFVVFVVVDAEETAVEGAAEGARGYWASPRERYNDDTKDLKLVLVIRRRLVGFVDADEALRSRRPWNV